MTVCPNCGNKIKRKRITEVGNESDLIKCDSCGAIMKPNEIYLFNKKSAIDWIGIILVMFGLSGYDGSKVISIIFITVCTLFYLIGLRRYMKSLKLNIIAFTDQNPINVFTGKKSHNSENDEIESYKRLFKLWSDERLKEVLEIKKWNKTAKKAAKELLNNKTKT